MNRSTLAPERPPSIFADPSMSEDAAFMREQARRCRRLARGIATPDVVATLNRMADEYDARADKMAAKGSESP